MLTREELKAAIGEKSLLATSNVGREALEKFRRELAEGRNMESLVDNDGRRLMLAVFRGMKDVVHKETITTLATERIYLVRSDVCNAVAVNLVGRAPAIIVFTGLLKAIQYFMELRRVIAMVAASVSSVTKFGTTEPSLSVTAFQAMMGICHFAAQGRSLERAGVYLPPDVKASLMHDFSQAMWFLIMHEVGHIRCNHFVLRGPGGFEAPPLLAVSEGLNRFKLQEFEADNFYIDTIQEDSRLYALNYVLDTLTIFSFIENHLAESKDTHPFAVNRLQRLVDRYGQPEDSFFLDRAKEIVENEVKARQTADNARNRSPEPGKDRLDVFATHAETIAAVGRLVSHCQASSVEKDTASVNVTAWKLWDHLVARWWDPDSVPPSPWSGSTI